MPLHVTWPAITLRLTLACAAGLLLGINRDERGRPAGMRTTMLVTLAATLAMLQVNLMLDMQGKTASSFAVMDLMRLPLGILSGIGFIGAGTILKRESTAIGVTTAATLWYSTVLGLLFGGGQIMLGSTATVLGMAVLLALKTMERRLPRLHRGTVLLQFAESTADERLLRQTIENAACRVDSWTVEYHKEALSMLHCELSWRAPDRTDVLRPEGLDKLRALPGVASFRWER